MAFLKGIFALVLALVAAVSFIQDPQGAYSSAGCGGATELYPQVTKDMPGTKYDCTLTIYNEPTQSTPISCGSSNEIVTNMYIFLRVNKGNEYWAFATKVENNCYGSFNQEQRAIERFVRDTVLPGIYDPDGDLGTTFCSVWLERQNTDPELCSDGDIPFALKSVRGIAEDAVDTDPAYPEWTAGMFVSIFNATVAVQD